MKVIIKSKYIQDLITEVRLFESMRMKEYIKVYTMQMHGTVVVSYSLDKQPCLVKKTTLFANFTLMKNEGLGNIFDADSYKVPIQLTTAA